jgi:hypothetical protein
LRLKPLAKQHRKVAGPLPVGYHTDFADGLI